VAASGRRPRSLSAADLERRVTVSTPHGHTAEEVDPMWEYLKRHEAFVIRSLDAGMEPERLAELRTFHADQIRLMQHERLAHLLVMLFVLLFMLLCFGFAATVPGWAPLAASVLLLVLSSFYIVHYFRLENGVQRWYGLANRIDAALGRVSPYRDETEKRAR
jgi:hypothetical protein